MSDPQSVQSQIAIAQLGKEVQYLREELNHVKESSQSLKEYSLGNFARFEIKMAIIIKASVFLATTTGGVMIFAFMNLILKETK